MTEELYIRGVIIANGIPDSDGDVLGKTEIKKLLSKYTEHQTDTMHTYIKNSGVDVIENWINETPTTVDGKQVPAGSWLCTTKVSNPDLIKNIEDGNLTAYSLGSLPDDAFTDKYWFINKSYKYSDFDIDNIQPLFISFVNRGANGYTFEIMNKQMYINKNMKKDGDIMADNDSQIENEKISINGLSMILDKLGLIKADKDNQENEKEKKDEEKPKSEPKGGENMDDFKKEILKTIADGISEGFKSINKNEKEEKPDDEEQKEDEKSEKKDKNEKPTPENGEDEEENESGKKDKEPPKIDKMDRQTSKTENVEIPQTTTNFYKLSGRDQFGCKIRK